MSNSLFYVQHIIEHLCRVHSTKAEETLEGVICSLFANLWCWVRRFWPAPPSLHAIRHIETEPVHPNSRVAYSLLCRRPLRRRRQTAQRRNRTRRVLLRSSRRSAATGHTRVR